MLEILFLFACPGKIFTVLIQLTWWKTRPSLHFRHINPLFLISAILTLFQLVWQSVHIPKNQGNLYISQATHRLRNIYSVSSNDQEIPSILSCSILLDYPFLSGHFCPFLCDVNPTSLWQQFLYVKHIFPQLNGVNI